MNGASGSVVCCVRIAGGRRSSSFQLSICVVRVPESPIGAVQRRERLGGMLSSYYREAA